MIFLSLHRIARSYSSLLPCQTKELFMPKCTRLCTRTAAIGLPSLLARSAPSRTRPQRIGGAPPGTARASGQGGPISLYRVGCPVGGKPLANVSYRRARYRPRRILVKRPVLRCTLDAGSCPRSRREAALLGPHRRLDARCDIELVQDVADVKVGRAHGDAQLLGDLFVA
jgi:hypothetical protein